MVSEIIEKEKKTQEDLMNIWVKGSRWKVHQQSLINLKEYMKDQLTYLDGEDGVLGLTLNLLVTEMCYDELAHRNDVDDTKIRQWIDLKIRDIKEDIIELDIMIKRYE